MQVSIKTNKYCLICHEAIKVNDNICIQKNGIVIHMKDCLKRMQDKIKNAEVSK